MSEPNDKRLILLSNDDGVGAVGLHALHEALQRLGDVVVVAPEQNQSGGSHSITIDRPLRHRRLEADVHAVDGTPADCLYIALHHDTVLRRRPDVVVSGINHGGNLGNDIYYSGTVAAAREGALRGIPAIAFSLCSGDQFAVAAEKASALVERFLCLGTPQDGTPQDQVPLLNINFPAPPFRGVLATCLGIRRYSDEVTVRRDPRGREYYWIGGASAPPELLEGTDTAAVDAGFVSVTPLQLRGTRDEHRALADHLAADELASRVDV